MTDFLVNTELDDRFDGGTIADETSDGGGLSLREALALARTAEGVDRITFDAAVQRIELSGEFLTIDSDLLINGDTDGDGQADITVASTWESLPVLRVTEGTTVTIESLILNGGTGRLQGGTPGVNGQRGFPGDPGEFAGSGSNGGTGVGIGVGALGGDGGAGGAGDGAEDRGAFPNLIPGPFGSAFGGEGGRGGNGGLGGDGGNGGDGGGTFAQDFLADGFGGDGGRGGDGGFGGGHGGNGGNGGRGLGRFDGRNGGAGDGGDAVGGIWNQGDLTLSRVELFGTTAIGGNSGERLSEFSSQNGGGGDAVGGVYTDRLGQLTLLDSAFSSTGASGRIGNSVIGGSVPNSASAGEPGDAFGVAIGSTSLETRVVGSVGVEDSQQFQVSTGDNTDTVDQLVYVFSEGFEVEEGEEFSLYINRLGDISDSVDVTLSIGGDVDDNDFGPVERSLNLAANERSAKVVLEFDADGAAEDSETFTISIASPNAVLGTSQLSGVVLDRLPQTFGTDAADSLFLTNESEEIHGRGGNDQIAARGGDDIVFGGAGNDTIGGGAGDDDLFGGEGDDLFFQGAGADLFDGGAGIDTVNYDSAPLRMVRIDTRGTEAAVGVVVDLETGIARDSSRIDDQLTGIENLIGTSGMDVFFGDDANNALFGGDGADGLNGRDGDDFLSDGAGRDVMFGGDGADIYAMALDGDIDNVKGFELGVDRIDLTAWGVDTLDALAVREKNGKLIVEYRDELLAIRGTQQFTLEDLSSDMFIFAENLEPIILEGTDENDKLIGTAEDERIIDGAGRDNLFGRGGSDVFVLVADGDSDSIKDFSVGSDLIDISAWEAVTLADLDITEHRSGKLFVRDGDELLVIRSDSGALTQDDLTEDAFIFG